MLFCAASLSLVVVGRLAGSTILEPGILPWVMMFSF
jgi:hypothetical protein